jgi:hypothetical protein
MNRTRPDRRLRALVTTSACDEQKQSRGRPGGLQHLSLFLSLSVYCLPGVRIDCDFERVLFLRFNYFLPSLVSFLLLIHHPPLLGRGPRSGDEIRVWGWDSFFEIFLGRRMAGSVGGGIGGWKNLIPRRSFDVLFSRA